jgi:ufm1-conjugating enzyme 1
MVDEVTKKTLSNIPLLKTKASPRDGEQWRQRLKEELQALIQVMINVNKYLTKFLIILVCEK